jgi:hypothetical protein
MVTAGAAAVGLTAVVGIIDAPQAVMVAPMIPMMLKAASLRVMLSNMRNLRNNEQTL